LHSALLGWLRKAAFRRYSKSFVARMHGGADKEDGDDGGASVVGSFSASRDISSIAVRPSFVAGSSSRSLVADSDGGDGSDAVDEVTVEPSRRPWRDCRRASGGAVPATATADHPSSSVAGHGVPLL
jgi:hypothetical protein